MPIVRIANSQFVDWHIICRFASQSTKKPPKASPGGHPCENAQIIIDERPLEIKEMIAKRPIRVNNPKSMSRKPFFVPNLSGFERGKARRGRNSHRYFDEEQRRRSRNRRGAGEKGVFGHALNGKPRERSEEDFFRGRNPYAA